MSWELASGGLFMIHAALIPRRSFHLPSGWYLSGPRLPATGKRCQQGMCQDHGSSYEEKSFALPWIWIYSTDAAGLPATCIRVWSRYHHSKSTFCRKPRDNLCALIPRHTFHVCIREHALLLSARKSETAVADTFNCNLSSSEEDFPA